jgi:cytochrome c-type biogenesis protein
LEDVSTTTNGARLLKGIILPALGAVLPLAAAVGGALATGSELGGVVGGVESLSSASSRLLGDLGTLIPLGFAFAAGMVSTVNPCGFAMLPAYLGLYMGSTESADARPSFLRRLARALLVGCVVMAGFVLLFGVVGAVIGGGVRAVVDVFPWIGLSMGVLLTVVGAWLLRGGKLYTALAGQAAARIGDSTSVGVRGYFLFGLSYGVASLSCTLPIFLAVVGTSVASEGFVRAVGQFLSYALGMGVVIIVLTLAIALFKGAMVGVLRRALPYVQPLSAGLMIIAGAYIVFYWLTIGGLLEQLG